MPLIANGLLHEAIAECNSSVVFALLFKYANSAEDKRTIALIYARKQHTQGFW